MVVVPKMAYAADVWYTPIYSMVSQKRNNVSVGYTHKLASVQRMALMAITGTLLTMEINLLYLHMNLLLVDLLLHKVCQMAAVRMAALLDTHPIELIFNLRARRHIKRHHLPLHELAFISDIKPDEVEKLVPVQFSPC